MCIRKMANKKLVWLLPLHQGLQCRHVISDLLVELMNPVKISQHLQGTLGIPVHPTKTH